MDSLLTNVPWLSVVISTVVTFIVGWLWYSPMLFAKPWMKLIGITEPKKDNMAPAMISQLVATFLLAWLVAVLLAVASFQVVVVLALAVAVLIKANGYWSDKGKSAIVVESGYALVMVLVIALVQKMMM